MSAEGIEIYGPKLVYDCPVCGGRETLGCDYKLDMYGRKRWLINCWHCPSDGYLAALSETTDVPQWKILEDPVAALGEPRAASDPKAKQPEPLPTPADLRQWTEGLCQNRHAMRYLTRERGLKPSTIREAELGYVVWRNHEAIALPIYQAGQLVNVKFRYFVEQPILRGKPLKIAGLRGRGHTFYPELRPGPGTLLCGGEFDALLARQLGFPAVSSTGGTHLSEQMLAGLSGRLVSVLFDVGEDEAAAVAVTRIQAAGAREAWAVHLPFSEHGTDITDAVVRHGWRKEQFNALIKKARRAAGGAT